MNDCHTTLCDLRSLIVNDRGTLGEVTIEGHQLAVLPLQSEEDMVFDLTAEGNFRGYVVLLSRQTKEIFLWHLLETARKNHDGDLMFPEKVQIPALSLASLVRISEKSVALEVWDNRWFLCSYKVTRYRVSRPLFENAVQALREPRICKGTKNGLVPVPKEYFKETPKECLINLRLLSDWKFKGTRTKLHGRVVGCRNRVRIRNGKVYVLR